MFWVFIDSNVIIETLIDVNPASRAVIYVASIGLVDLWTSQTCIDEINRYLSRFNPSLVSAFQVIVEETDLHIQPSAPPDIEQAAFSMYLPAMLDVNDIPVLASALTMQPLPTVILSNNDAHFNQDVAARSGLSIMTCQAFLEEIADALRTLF